MASSETGPPGSASPYYPKIVLCIPGSWADPGDLQSSLGKSGYALEGTRLRRRDGSETLELEFQPHSDPRMRKSFEASACRLRPSLELQDYDAVERHRSVLYLLSRNYDRSDAARVAALMLEAGVALIDAGGSAMKCDSSGIAHSAKRWSELLEATREAGGPSKALSVVAQERELIWTPLFEAFVRLPIVTKTEELYSCGMHLLGCPDGIVELGDFDGKDAWAANEVLESFLRSLRVDTGPESVALSHTFRAPGTTDRFLSAREACTRYQEDAFFWNRWGYFRLRRQ